MVPFRRKKKIPDLSLPPCISTLCSRLWALGVPNTGRDNQKGTAYTCVYFTQSNGMKRIFLSSMKKSKEISRKSE